MKFFLLLVLFLLVVWLVRGGRRGPTRPDPPQAPAEPPIAEEATREDIVACIHCGVHLPQSEALAAPDGWFCGQAHRLAHEKSAAP